MGKREDILKSVSKILILPLSFIFMPQASIGQNLNPIKLVHKFNEVGKYKQLEIASEQDLFKNYIRWVDDKGRVSKEAKTLVSYIENSNVQGLNPDNYKIDKILIFMSPIPSEYISANSINHLNQLLTESFVKYVQDMSAPRIDPAKIGSKYKYWRKNISVENIYKKLLKAKSLDQMLSDLEPKVPIYKVLKKELEHLLKDYPSISAGSKEKLETRKKIEQIIVNMEKLRWDKKRENTYIESNIAEQILRVVESGKEIYKTKIIVGKTPLGYQSHEFTVGISGVRFNPPWYVPRSIMLRSELPLLKKDPKAFKKMNIKVYFHKKLVDPAKIDWNKMTVADLKHVRMIQKPGRKNVLGHIRVLMNNPYSEYMHYTNTPWLFKRNQRTLSSGCLRMEEPDKVAAFIMGMTKEQILQYKKDGKTVNVRTSKDVEFYNVYHTIVLTGEGKLKYLTDIYGRDKVIFRALDKQGKVPAMKKHSYARFVYNLSPLTKKASGEKNNYKI